MRVASLLLIVAPLAATTAAGAEPRSLAWPAGPMEVRVALAGPIEPSDLEMFAGRTIPFGEAGDDPRPALRIAAVRLADGGRTLRLMTDPHPRPSTYSLDLPGLRTDYDLSGIEASWDDGTEGAKPGYVGWWPDLDIEAARAKSAPSAEHARAFALLKKPGRLTLATLVKAPRGKGAARLTLEANTPFVEATLGGEAAEVEGKTRITFDLEPTGEPVDLSLTLRTGDRPPTLHATLQAGKDADARLKPDLLTVPWAPSSPPTAAESPPLPFKLTGGDRAKGEAVFYSDEAKCSTCHRVRGKGGEVGPDLTKLVGRDPATVYRDIAEPSAVIRPEYIPYTVATRDGRIAVGLVRAEGADAIRVLDTEAKSADFPRADIDQLRPGNTSIMPVGLAGALGEDRMRDLLRFLLTPAPGEGAKP